MHGKIVSVGDGVGRVATTFPRMQLACGRGAPALEGQYVVDIKDAAQQHWSRISEHGIGCHFKLQNIGSDSYPYIGTSFASW